MATACDATTSIRQPLRAFRGAAHLHRTRTSSRNHRVSYRIKPTGEASRTRINTEPGQPTITTNRGSSGNRGLPGIPPDPNRSRAPGEPSRTRVHIEPGQPTAATNRGGSGELRGFRAIVLPGQHRRRAPGEPSRTRVRTEPGQPTVTTNR